MDLALNKLLVGGADVLSPLFRLRLSNTCVFLAPSLLFGPGALEFLTAASPSIPMNASALLLSLLAEVTYKTTSLMNIDGPFLEFLQLLFDLVFHVLHPFVMVGVRHHLQILKVDLAAEHLFVVDVFYDRPLFVEDVVQHNLPPELR